MEIFENYLWVQVNYGDIHDMRHYAKSHPGYKYRLLDENGVIAELDEPAAPIMPIEDAWIFMGDDNKRKFHSME